VTLTQVAVDEGDGRVEQGLVTVTRDGVVLGTADASVRVMRLKPDGKSEMDATAWARGVRDINGSTWKALS